MQGYIITSGGIKMESNKERNNVKVLTDSTFDSFVRSPKLSIVDFWAAWCAPCRYLSPVVEDLSLKYNDKANFGKLNVDENPGISTLLKIESIPTLLFFKNGKIVDTSIGVVPKEILIKKIESLA